MSFPHLNYWEIMYLRLGRAQEVRTVKNNIEITYKLILTESIKTEINKSKVSCNTLLVW